MKKIGILSMQRIFNYGSFLQAYGLMQICKEIGGEVEFVDYHPGKCLILSEQKRGISRKISKVTEEHTETRKAVKIYKSFSAEEKAVVVQSLAQSLNKPKRSSNPYQMSLFDREVSEKKERAGSGCER